MTDQEIIASVAMYIRGLFDPYSNACEMYRKDWKAWSEKKDAIQDAAYLVFKDGIKTWLAEHGVEANVYLPGCALNQEILYEKETDQAGRWRGYTVKGKEVHFRVAVGIWNAKGDIGGRAWMNKIIVRGPGKRDVKHRVTTDHEFLIGGKAWGIVQFVKDLEAAINEGKESAWKHE